MGNLIEELLRPLGFFAVVVLAAAWLLRAALTALLDRERERAVAGIRHQHQQALETIRNDANLEIERFKASLALLSEEHKVRFSALHQRRNETLTDLYNAVADALTRAGYIESAKEYLSAEQLAEDCQYVQDHCESARKLLARGRLYLQAELVETIDSTVSKIEDPAHLFLCDVALGKHERQPGLEPSTFPIAAARAELENIASQFRALLGTA